MKSLPELKQKFRQLWPHLNERGKRMVAAEEALQLGFGGISLVSRACGLSRVTDKAQKRWGHVFIYDLMLTISFDCW
jgi:hypothetical protein